MFYPLMINIENKRITIIGGGRVALRKAKKLLEFKGRITVVSSTLIEEFWTLKEEQSSELEIIQDVYKTQYIKGSFLVIAATSSQTVNKNISEDCNRYNILCNVVDDIKLSDFIVPSSVKRGSLVLSVSTTGKSPSLASKIKRELEEKYSQEYEEYLELLGEVRDFVIENYSHEVEKRKILKDIVDMNLHELKEFFKDIKISKK